MDGLRLRIRNISIKGLLVFICLVMSSQTLMAGEVLAWPGAEKDVHPRLYVTPADVARVKSSRSDLAALASADNFGNNIDMLIEAVLFTDNQAAQKSIVDMAKAKLDQFYGALDQTFGMDKGPHVYNDLFGQTVGLTDAALAVKTISAGDRAAILEKIAKICYKLNRPDFWGFDPWRGAYNYNMWTVATAYRLAFAALIPSHPMAKEWIDKAVAEHKWQIDNWIDYNGGNAETPHYAGVSINQWLASFVIARNAGVANDGHLFDEKMKLAVLNVANISTPPDAKFNNQRRLPSVGHTYSNERSNIFRTMAYIWKGKDPQFAAEMAWMHDQHGKPDLPGIKSPYGGFTGYKSFFADLSGITPKKPSWTSQVYPEVGVQLRNTIGSDRETTLYMIAGRHHNHHFNDSGSITVWGKGAEFCDEDSYDGGRKPVSGEYKPGMYREVHSMPDNPSTYNFERVMHVQEFSTSEIFDYVNGERQGWRRQIGFVKDKDPLAPNYFVIADSFDKTAAPTIWRLYVAGDCTVTPNGVTVAATDKPDVVMDVIFLPLGEFKPQLKETTRKYEGKEYTNKFIRVNVEKPGTLTAVLYPRLKSEAAPQVSMLKDGGVQVKSAAGTDVVYLAPEAVKAELGGKPFEGKAGLAKTRGGKTLVAAPGACEVKPGWEGGDPQMRALVWEGPQLPCYIDYEEALVPNQGNVLVVGGDTPGVAENFIRDIHGSKPRQATRVEAAAESDALVVTFNCEDKDFLAQNTERDSIKLWKDDCVYVWLDLTHDHKDVKKWIMIQVSGNGNWHDARDEDPSWNIELKNEIKRTADGYTAVIRIPWKGLGVSKPAAGTVWGVNFSRMDQPGKIDLKKMQVSSWCLIPNLFNPTMTDRWGHLIFTDDGNAEAGIAAMEKVHKPFKDRAYSREVLLK